MLRKILRRLILREKSDSESYIKYLRAKGIVIGEGTTIYEPQNTLIDPTRPWLISIGENCKITRGTTILSHGYDWCVLKAVYGEILGSAGKVCIGDNVFIGMHSTILKGVSIGNNVIIGANSLVTHDIPDNCVAAGNPARVIMFLDEYYYKRKNSQEAEGAEMVREYIKRYQTMPPQQILQEFFWLFSDGEDTLPDCWKQMMSLMGNEAQSYECLRINKKKYESMDLFIKSIEK
jgi:acetyltransferase-like isoleucine patch superfamily enzyme